MARYWVGGTASWDGTAGTKWATTSGGAGGASVPTSSDDVFFDAASGAVTVTIAAGNTNCLSLDFTGFTGTMAGTAAISIFGNLTMATGMTRSYTGTLTFAATGTGKTITMNGKAFAGAVTFNGVGGGWTLQDAFSIGTGTLTLTAGTLNLNGKTTTASSMVISGATTRTLTCGAAAINLTTTWNAATTTNLTFNVNTSTITLSNTGTVTFSGGGLTYNNVTFTGAGNPGAITGANTFANFTATMSGTNSMRFELGANQIVSGTLTATGASAGGGRVRFGSNIRGTQRTITAAAVSLTNVDFSDIIGAGAATWTGTSIADASNNTNITFTTPVTRYYVGNTGAWDVTTSWSTTSGGSSGASVPLCHDTAVFDANSFSANGQTLTINPGNYPSVDFTNIDQTVTVSIAANAYFISNFKLKAGMSVTTGCPTMYGLGSTSVDFAGVTLDVGNWTIDVGTGTLSILSAVTLGSTRTLALSSGTLSQNGFDITAGLFSDSSTTETKTLSQGSNTIFLTGAGVNVWSTLGTGLTVSGTGSIELSTNTASSRTITANSQQINNIKVSAGTGAVTLTNVNCNNLDFTGFAGSLAAGTVAITVRGNLTAASGMTFTASTFAIIMAATSGTKTITSNGRTIDRPFTINGSGGTFQLTGALTLGSTRAFTLTAGTFDANDFNVTTGTVSISGASTRSLLMGNGSIWTIRSSGASTWLATTTTNLTFNAETSKIILNDATVTNKTFSGGGLTYYHLLLSGAGTGTFTIAGSNTFSIFEVDTPPHTVIFTAGTTQTISSASGWRVSGTLGNLITIQSTTTTNAILSCSSGVIESSYLSIADSTAQGGATWYAGSTSTDGGGGNSGWIFNNAPLFPNALAAVFSLPSYATETDSSFSAATLSAIFSIPLYSAYSDFTLAQSALSAIFTTPSFTISNATDASVSPSVISLVFSTISSIIWTRLVKNSSSYSNTPKSSTPSFSNKAKSSTIWSDQSKSANPTYVAEDKSSSLWTHLQK